MSEIPKIMWQTHEWEYEKLPDIYLKNTQSWKEHNPDWEYRYHNSGERRSFLIKNNFLRSQKSIDLYDKMDKQLQSEIWRAGVIWFYGGAYIDMDSIPREMNLLSKSIENAENLNKPYSIICTNDPMHLKIGCNNAHFIGKKNSEFLRALLDKYELPLHKKWPAHNEDIHIQRIEFIINSKNFARMALYRDDIAFVFGDVFHGDDYKPENWRELTDAFYKI